MGKDTAIAWTDHTFNPWEGCTKVSAGCAHCYAETRNARFGGGTAPNWGPGASRRRTSAANWRQPLKWNFTAICDECGETAGVAAIAGNLGKCPKCHADAMRRPRVFCASLADWLDDEVPIEWLADLLDLIRRTPNLDWQLLTKRPENWRERLSKWRDAQLDSMSSPRLPRDLYDWVTTWLQGSPPTNVWIGTTVEDQARADERIPALLKIPACVRFLSMEPLLGLVDIIHTIWNHCPPGIVLPYTNRHDDKTLASGLLPGIAWVIVGGESGPKARPFVAEHAWDIIGQCRSGGVAVFMKQLGSRPVTSNANAMEWPDDTVFVAIGEGAAEARVVLNDKNGRNQDEWPEELRAQEFPEVSRV